MKKIRFMILCVLAWGFCACEKDRVEGGTEREASNVTFRVNTPAFANSVSRALQLDVYDVRVIAEAVDVLTDKVVAREVVTSGSKNELTVSMNLEEGTYDFLFWADQVERGSREDKFYFADSLTEVIVPMHYTGNDEGRDAFCGKLENVRVTPSKPLDESITLTRKMAKLEIRATDVADSDLFVRLRYTSEIGEIYNVRTGVVTDFYMEDGYGFGADAMGLDAGGMFLAMDYIFVPASGKVSLELEVSDTNNKVLNTIPLNDLPLKPNFRTRVATLLHGTSASQMTISMDTLFAEKLEIDLDQSIKVVDDVCCVSSGKSMITIGISSQKAPSVEIPAEYSWITCTSTLDTARSVLQFSVDTNTTNDYRKGFVKVKGQYGVTRTISVYQGVGDSLWIHVKTPETLRTLVGKERMETTCGLKLSGMLGQDDYDAMKYSMSQLVSIDMEEVENTSIPARAFYGKSVFKRIVLPAKLEEIGDNAFYDCGFRGELKFPETVTRIGSAAFESCNNITGMLRLPAGLQEVGEYAFAQCTGLRGDLILPDGLKVINRRAFYGNYFDGKLVLPASCVEIGESAFNGCESLTGDVVIPDGVRKIGKEAFNYCKKISGVTLSAALEEIGESAFNYCIKLTGDLVIPSNVRIIGDKAFASCAFTGTLTLPSGLETIGTEAFLACSFTGGLNLPSTLTRIGKGAFSSCSGFTGNLIIPENVKVIEALAFADCRGLNGTLTLPLGLERIEQQAFWSCKSLSGTLVLPASLRTIGKDAFSYCDSFSGDLVIPEGVTEIASNAFCCKGMKNTIVLPSTLVSLGYQAFYGMPDIAYVRCNRKEPLALSLSPFANAAECTLIVPKGALEAYRAADKWKEFAVIEEEK